MSENGEALRYIELVLQQLRRASRDHRRLVQQRHADFRCGLGGEGSSGCRYASRDERVRHGRRGGPEGPSAMMDSRSSSSLWEPDASGSSRQVLGRGSGERRPDVTTRLLTKRRDYGGTAQSAAGILGPAPPGRVQDGVAAAAYQDLRYVPREDVDWESVARETFGAWSLLEAPSADNDGRTSSTLV